MLKRLIVLGFAALSTGLYPRALAAADPPQVGFIGGLTRSSGFPSTDWSAGSAFEAGVFGSARVSKRADVDVQVELLYSRRATRRTLSDGIAEIRSSLVLDFLEVPILLKRAVRPVGSVVPVVFGGMFTAVNVRARSGSRIGEETFDENVIDMTRRWDYGVVAGAGLEIRRAWHTWLGEVRYSHGFRRIDREQTGEGWKTRTLSLLFGVKW